MKNGDLEERYEKTEYKGTGVDFFQFLSQANIDIVPDISLLEVRMLLASKQKDSNSHMRVRGSDAGEKGGGKSETFLFPPFSQNSFSFKYPISQGVIFWG